MATSIVKRINDFFPLVRLFKFILFLAVSIQVVVITYNHFSGFYPLRDTTHFFLRLSRGTIYSIVAGFLIALPDLFIIYKLDRWFPWGKRFMERVGIQLVLAVVWAFTISTVITLLANYLSAYTEPLQLVLIYNALIYAVTNIIVMIVLEAWLFFMEGHRAKEKAHTLEKEMSQMRFEMLKSQINPHFMFNSLNVLSGLIDKNPAQAQLFIDEFSSIYRYVLETIEQPVTTLKDELDFIRSYMFLQKMRYGENLTYSVEIPSAKLDTYLPPLSLQVVIENAIKHNIVNEAKPLQIDIYTEKSVMVVKNPIQPKISGTSTGVGLKNLQKRYALITQLTPSFTIVNNQYIAKLPLLDPEHDERDNH
ncbi:MAG: histidine kinase [Cyclobacteriaceae bacterium]|nr:histidine kinase [Cyclobacteriaceae bacterium]